MALLRKGMAGEPVKRLQAKLGVTADGIFGSGTEKALKQYQSDHGLSSDGIAGPDTFTQMGLPELIMLRVGSRGQCVKDLQMALGIDADGKYGKGTAQAVRELQDGLGLPADGIAGPATLARIEGFHAVDEATVAKSEVPEDFEFDYGDAKIDDSADLSDVTGDSKPPAEAMAASASSSGGKSIWSTVKGFFS